MAERFRIPFIHDIAKGRFFYLLIALLLYFGLVPLLGLGDKLRLLMNIFFTAAMLAGIYAVSQKKIRFLTAVIIATPMIGLNWISQFVQSTALTLAGNFFTILFLGFFIVILLLTVFEAHEITTDVIYAAIAGYLIIGLMWAFVFEILENFFPGSFNMSQDFTTQTYTYFSFVTLTTLGYGDIAPLTVQARSFAFIEAVIGHFYLTVLIARLVGIHISQSMEKMSR